MEQIKEQRLTGERALFHRQDLDITECTFADGESPLKEGKNLRITHTTFQWKYPLWYCDHVDMEYCTMFTMARAGIWYSNHVTLKNATYEAPKGFRRCQDLTLENVAMQNASETLWNCNDVKMKNVTAKGDYFAMGSTQMEIDHLTLVGNYSFDGCRDLTIRNSRLLSKDAFWNCENVTVYDSYIAGEYLGWNAKNVTLINCTVESEQGMCYIENIVMKNCKLFNTNLAFEYSTVDAQIDSRIDSIKNPISGRITANGIGEIIFDNDDVQEENTTIEVKKSDEL